MTKTLQDSVVTEVRRRAALVGKDKSVKARYTGFPIYGGIGFGPPAVGTKEAPATDSPTAPAPNSYITNYGKTVPNNMVAASLHYKDTPQGRVSLYTKTTTPAPDAS